MRFPDRSIWLVSSNLFPFGREKQRIIYVNGRPNGRIPFCMAYTKCVAILIRVDLFVCLRVEGLSHGKPHRYALWTYSFDRDIHEKCRAPVVD